MKRYARLVTLLQQAKAGGFALTKLNCILWLLIPFNQRHGLKIKEVGENHVSTSASYKRSNLNHIRGIHACAIATIAEFSSGILLMTKLDPQHYRIIMSELRVEYHYQARKNITATTTITDEEIRTQLVEPLETQEAVLKTITSSVTDANGKHVATAYMTWQLKLWSNVRSGIDN